MHPCLLFDLDGTMVHTDHLHFKAFQELLAEDGRTLDLATFNARILGHPNVSIFAEFFPKLSADAQRALADAKEARVRAMLGGPAPLPPSPGLIALLDWADVHGVRYAVVTNAPPANAEIMLAASGLAPRFPIVVSGETLPHGKPHPLPYQEGLRLTGGDAARTVAFEDSLSGLKSAVAAGFVAIGMGASTPAEQLRADGARHVAADFRDAGLLAIVAATLGLPRTAIG